MKKAKNKMEETIAILTKCDFRSKIKEKDKKGNLSFFIFSKDKESINSYESGNFKALTNILDTH